MTDQPVAGQPLTPEQAAFLTARAARQAEEESASIAAEQAATAAQMTERGPLLPAEVQADQRMAELIAQSERLAAQLAAQQVSMQAMGSQVGVMQRQLEEAQAASGGPLTLRYAQAVADKLEALAAQWPNFPAGREHFSPAHSAAAALVEAATGVVKGTGPADAVHAAADAVERFAARGHARAGGAPIDWSAVLDDVDLAREEAVKLAAVA